MNVTKEKKQKKSSPIVIGIVVALIGVILIIAGMVELIGIKSGDKIDLATCQESDIEDGAYVEVDLDGDVTFVYGYYAEMQETSYGVFKRSTDRYYLIDACANADYFMGIKVSKSYYDEMEDIYDYSYGETTSKPETLHLVGKVRKQTGDAENYMENFICDLLSYFSYDTYSFTKSDIEGYYLPYYIDVVTTSDYLIPLVLGLVLLVIAIVIFVSANSRKNKVSYTQPEGGYADAQNMGYTDPYAGTQNTGYTDPYAGAGNTGYTDPYAGAGNTGYANPDRNAANADNTANPDSSFTFKQ